MSSKLYSANQQLLSFFAKGSACFLTRWQQTISNAKPSVLKEITLTFTAIAGDQMTGDLKLLGQAP